MALELRFGASRWRIWDLSNAKTFEIVAQEPTILMLAPAVLEWLGLRALQWNQLQYHSIIGYDHAICI